MRLDYEIVLLIWLLGLALAIVGTLWHLGYWRQIGAFNYWLHHAAAPPEAPLDSVAGGWLRDAVFQFGVRILLVVMGIERVLLQVSIPTAERDSFAASPLQLGLAFSYLLILLWLSRWTLATRQARQARRQRVPDVTGHMLPW